MTKLMNEIIQNIRTLPPAGLREAAGYIHVLRTRSMKRRNEVLRSTATSFSAAEAKSLEKSIAEGCEGIDPNAW